jgi:hypothetical protein
MAKQNPLQAIMNKPLSRKEFLQHVGVMLLAVFGITQAIQHLLNHESHPKPAVAQKTTRGWGGGKFGV